MVEDTDALSVNEMVEGKDYLSPMEMVDRLTHLVSLAMEGLSSEGDTRQMRGDENGKARDYRRHRARLC